MQHKWWNKWAIAAGLAVVGMALTASANADEWHLGPQISYASGVNDVADLYENNYNATHTYSYVKVHMQIPVGLAFAADYQWNSGLRADVGLGPFFTIKQDDRSDRDNRYYDDSTDLHYYEVPVNATVGYSFIPHGSVSPYIRAGVAYHFVSGDYYRSSTPGLFAAVGLEFSRTNTARYVLEIAADQSQVEFDNLACTDPVCANTVKLHTYDVVASFAAKFKL